MVDRTRSRDRQPAGQYGFAKSTRVTGGNEGPPALSAPTAGTPNSTGTANATVITNHGPGTLYWAVVTNNGVATNAQIIAGTGGNIVVAGNQAVGIIGLQTVASITGLTTATLYQIKFVQTDTAAAQSNQASVNLTTT